MTIYNDFEELINDRKDEELRKMSLEQAIFDILTDCDSVDLLEFLIDNNYIDLDREAESLVDDLKDFCGDDCFDKYDITDIFEYDVNL